MDSMEKMLNQLWGTQIQEFNLDLNNHKINMVINADDKRHIKLEIWDISSFYWVDDHFQIDNDSWGFMQLEEFHILKGIKVQSTGGHFNESSAPNLLLEIWNSRLLIEAQKITIDNQTFQLI